MVIIRRPAMPKLTLGRVIGGAVVLALATTGTAYAANEWTGANIVNESLTSADIKNNNLGSADILDGSLRAVDVAPDALTGAVVKESTLGQVPDADSLDGLDSADFSRVFAMDTKTYGLTLAAPETFGLAPGFTPALSGRCTVTGTVQAFGPASADRGPFFRLAVKRGANPPTDEILFGHYINGKPSHGWSASMSRTSTLTWLPANQSSSGSTSACHQLRTSGTLCTRT